MNETKLYPSISQALWLVLRLVIFQFLAALVISFAIGFGKGAAGLGSPTLPVEIALANLIAFALVLMWALKRRKIAARDVFPLSPIPTILILPMVLTLLGLTILLSEMDNLTRSLIPMPNWIAEVSAEVFSGGVWGVFLILVVVAPITEELFFRGLLLRGFLSRYGVSKAIIVSAIIFAVFHLNPWQFISATAAGILFAWWFFETRSLLPCLFGHAVYNAFPLVTGAVGGLEIKGFSTGEVVTAADMMSVEFQPIWFDLTGLVLTGLGIWLLVVQFRKTRSPAQVEP